MADLMSVAESVLGRARGGEDLEAYAIHNLGVTIEAGADGQVRHVERAETRGVGVRLIKGLRLGYASTSDLSAAALTRAVDRARDNALVTDRDRANRLPIPAPMSAVAAAGPSATADISSRAPASLDERIALTTRLARQVVALDPRVRAFDTAAYHDEQTEAAVASTRGVNAAFDRRWVQLTVDAIGEDRYGPVSDSAFRCAPDLDDIDVDLLARDAVGRTVRLLGSEATSSTGPAVLLDPTVVATLLSAVGRACSGGPMSSGRSPFAGSLLTSVAAPCVTLVDDGTLLTSPAASTHDDEGVPRRRTELISRGVLVAALHSTTTAVAIGDGASSTGNARRANYKVTPRAAPTTLLLAPTTSLDQIFADNPDAVYVQQLVGAGSGLN
ncbi:MAG: TldD/PmbA family protein, partial [Nocardioidaceae bacterium]